MNRRFTVLGLLAISSAIAGCAKSPEGVNPPPAQVAGDEHKHDGWWCAEHGVPESVCGLCSAKLAAEFKAKGDWCDKHDRPLSQCFVCKPEREAEFAALYEAKFGVKPPKPEPAEEASTEPPANKS